MRKGVIDLDWLDGVIEDIELCHKIVPEGLDSLLGLLKEVRSKCTLIESEKEQPPVFLSKTCVNNWESNRFCDKEGACEMCVNGKLK